MNRQRAAGAPDPGIRDVLDECMPRVGIHETRDGLFHDVIVVITRLSELLLLKR
jgi:hypothetical protein